MLTKICKFNCAHLKFSYGLAQDILSQKCGTLKFSNVFCRFYNNGSTAKVKLATVGSFNSLKLNENYTIGQLFLHRVFGYRGVILFPWVARVFDRDALKNKDNIFENSPELIQQSLNCNQMHEDIKGKSQTYYQVLIDDRDCPYIRAQTEAVTFLGHQDNGGGLYAIAGLDYVAHEDVMPYTAVDKRPIQHDLFDRFFEYTSDKDTQFDASDMLKSWQERNSCWLELSDVYKQTTKDIRITVIPFYMGCRTTQNASKFWWRYCIRMENLGEQTVLLRERHWQTFSLSGGLETLRERSVVGQEPVLSQEQPAFQYSSHILLRSPSGHMWGFFRMERADGDIDCGIPLFSLESKKEAEKTPSDLV